MQLHRALALLLAAAASAATAASYPTVPSLDVPACSRGNGTVTYNRSVPDLAPFPRTRVDVCYDDLAIRFVFTALDEVNFFVNPNYTTNDPIYEYEVMEAFIYQGTRDPRSYLEFEVAPNNVTFNAFIYNPSKVRAPGAPFDGAPIRQPVADGIVATTRTDRSRRLWMSTARIPLGFFNVDDGKARGTRWRMNFFRTVVARDTFPAQLLGAWNPPDEPSFHKTPFFGNVNFV